MLSQNYEFGREIITWLLKKKGNMKPGQISKMCGFSQKPLISHTKTLLQFKLYRLTHVISKLLIREGSNSLVIEEKRKNDTWSNLQTPLL